MYVSTQMVLCGLVRPVWLCPNLGFRLMRTAGKSLFASPAKWRCTPRRIHTSPCDHMSGGLQGMVMSKTCLHDEIGTVSAVLQCVAVRPQAVADFLELKAQESIPQALRAALVFCDEQYQQVRRLTSVICHWSYPCRPPDRGQS